MKFEVGVMDWVNTDPTHLPRAANTSEPSRSSKGEATAPPTDRFLHGNAEIKLQVSWFRKNNNSLCVTQALKYNLQ